MHTLSEQVYQIRSGTPAGVLEATFVPRHAGSPEGDGYVIVPVSWWAENRGEYLIFDTDDITKGPICRIELPFRLGWTGHGHWLDFRARRRSCTARRTSAPPRARCPRHLGWWSRRPP